MPVDSRGYPVTAADSDVARLLDAAVIAYLGSRADTRDRLDEVLAADPNSVLAHCLDGYLHLLSSTRAAHPLARDALARARSIPARTDREAAHVAAFAAWLEGDFARATHRWGELLAGHPRDLLAIRVSQFVLSYLGESKEMRRAIEAVLPSWDASVPGYGFFLGCHAYALEEAGDYAAALDAGERAVELDPEDIWAAHAVTHVREMQGDWNEGIDWITRLAPSWSGCGNFGLHLRWHEALFHLELERYDRVLELYDREVRPEPTDQYLDVTNAVSLLWRLEQDEVSVGTRWTELADRAEAHLDDHALVFADLHYLMALAAAGRTDAAGRFLRSCEEVAGGRATTEARVMAEVGLPLARGVLAHRREAYGDVVDLVLPVHGAIRRIGGSHAQRDLFERLLIDAAVRSGRLEMAALLLAARIANRPRNRWGWKHYAQVLERLLRPEAADARRILDRLSTR